MKISLVSIEDSLISIGVRKVAGYMRGLNPQTKIYYVPLSNYFSLRGILRPRRPAGLSCAVVEAMAEPIADADIVAFSSMTHVAGQTKLLAAAVRKINPAAYIIWGGIHPIIVPEDAIGHADAICTGEGEFAFAEFFEAFRHERDFTATRNFWFNHRDQTIRNGFRPLMGSQEMEQLPIPTYADNELVFSVPSRRYTELTRDHYLRFTGLTYNTIWTIGCPFHCTFCGNTKFLENDRGYTKLRYPSPQWIVNEINAARRKNPYISNVIFHDDSLMALPSRVLAEFAKVYKEQVGLPFCVPGVIPNYVKPDKVEILLEAGMNRLRMGIQSGSRRVLEFYKRPSPPEKVLAATQILGEYSKYMIPPAYDFILDNPIETRSDIVDTLELLYKMRRPFTLNLFSLRVQPNTTLAKQFEELKIGAEDMGENNYWSLRPTWANCLVMLLAIVRPPRWIFRRLLRKVRAVNERQRLHETLYLVLRLLYLSKRAISHLRFMDFSVLPGNTARCFWRLGLVGWRQRRLLRRFTRIAQHSEKSAPRDTLRTIMLPVLPLGSWFEEMLAAQRKVAMQTRADSIAVGAAS